MITGINHVTVIAGDSKATLNFYEDILGLKVGYRPDLGFDGAWLKVFQVHADISIQRHWLAVAYRALRTQSQLLQGR